MKVTKQGFVQNISLLLENEGHTIRICTKYYTFILSCLYVRLENEGHTIRICTKYYTFFPPFLYVKAKK